MTRTWLQYFLRFLASDPFRGHGAPEEIPDVPRVPTDSSFWDPSSLFPVSFVVCKLFWLCARADVALQLFQRGFLCFQLVLFLLIFLPITPRVS